MIYAKVKNLLTISGGTGAFNTISMRGRIEHLIVRPASNDTVWNMTITDRQGDVICDKKGEVGRMDDFSGYPVGWDRAEKLTVSFTSVSANEVFTITMKNREKT